MTAVAIWRRWPAGARLLAVLVALIVAVNVVAAGAERAFGGETDGPTDSSYTTANDGLAAYADLLSDRGHPVERLRRPMARASLDPAATLVITGASALSAADRETATEFVVAGGRLVITGSGAVGALRAIAPDLRWSARGVERATVLAPVGETRRLSAVAAAGDGSWSDPASGLPVLGDRDRVLTVVIAAGAGRVVAIADPAVLQNRLIGDLDNAAFALDIAGAADRPVVFAEAHHGFGTGSGIGAIPASWRWALAGVLVAAVIWFWSRGKRLGPPEDVERALPPPRAAHVDAMAATLARTHDPGPALERMRAALVRAGMSDQEVADLFGPAPGDRELVAAGRALARTGAMQR